jgi:hypothetical protein
METLKARKGAFMNEDRVQVHCVRDEKMGRVALDSMLRNAGWQPVSASEGWQPISNPSSMGVIIGECVESALESPEQPAVEQTDATNEAGARDGVSPLIRLSGG